MRKIAARVLGLLAALALLTPYAVRADDTRSDVVNRLASDLETIYVFPDRGHAAATRIRARLADHAYDSIDDDAFATALTADLRDVLHDKHVDVFHSLKVLRPETGPGTPPTDAQRQAARENAARMNFGINGVQLLTGNVGYINIVGFDRAEFAAPTMAAAMQFISHADAIIIDERRNHGGDPDTVAMLVSYFFPKDARVHVNDFGMRQGDHETRTSTYTTNVAGPRFPNTPLYVLTSAQTFSGGEEFAYDIQALKRGTLVGETTGGGANPGGTHRIGDHFSAFIPDGRAINPITNTNWEGTGVKPDVAVSKTDAFKTAYLSALRGRLPTAPPQEVPQLTGYIAAVEKMEPPDLLQRIYGPGAP